jgi:ATP-dependent RNA helicase DeaD
MNSSETQFFSEMSLSPALAQALKAMAFEKPTPIQAQAIPPAVEGRDVIGCAQTGTGKTAAFCIPLISRLERHSFLSALILVPTREIAAQIEKVLSLLTQGQPTLRPVLLIGGKSMDPQRRQLSRRPRIIVATPGRLVDHLRQGSVRLESAGLLVLDEADRMLDMGFAPDLNRILQYLPPNRQTLLFTATLAPEVEKLALRLLRKPVQIKVGTVSRPIAKIRQSVLETDQKQKSDVLLDELNRRDGSVLIFTRTKRRTDKLAKFLDSYGHDVARLHGDRSQAQRTAALDGFRSGKVRILVATDVAARGIDVPHISHVINFDLPSVPEDYVHRIGRTARNGAGGEAVSFITPEDRQQWRAIQKVIGTAGPTRQ